MKLTQRLRYYILRKLDAVDAIHYRGQRDYNEVLEQELRQSEGTIRELEGDIDHLRAKVDSLYKALWPAALKCALNDLEKHQNETMEAV